MLSVRDLVRQIPAEWQENVKHRAALSYGAFLDQIQDPRREGRIPTWFWGVQEIPDILDRWGHDLPPEHVHVVTVPPAGGSPELLWKRFVEAFGLDGIDLQLDGERVNPSLGVGRDHADPADQPRRQRGARAGLLPAAGPRAARPPDAVAPHRAPRGSPCRPTSTRGRAGLEESWIAEIQARGYDVIGDLDDLRGAPPVDDYADPDHPDESLVSGAAVDALKAVLLDHARLQRELGQRDGELVDTQRSAGEGPPAADVPLAREARPPPRERPAPASWR